MSKGTVVTANVNYILENKIKILKGLPLIEISKLKLHPNNIKSHPQEQINNLKKLIQMIGFKDPIVIDKFGEVKAGHGRLLAAQELGMKQVPYIPLEGLTKKQMDMFMYMDNQVNESPWIDDNVQLLLQDMPETILENYDVNWDDIITAEPPDEEEVPEPPIEPKAKLGDIYQLGNHRIMCGDSTKDLVKLLEGNTVDLLLTDPPYGISVVQNGGIGGGGPLGFTAHTQPTSKMNNKIIHRREYKKIIGDDKLFDPYFLLEYGKLQIIFGANNYSDKLPMNHHWLVWDKKSGDSSHYTDTFSDAELMWTNLSNRTNVKIYRHVWDGLTRAGNRKTELKERVHPTQKPVGLLSNIIKDYSKENHTVLDPYLGSGSTLIACEQTNRVCYGMELDPSYISIILDRWSNYTSKDPVRVSDGKKWSKIKEE